jgi:hypothetical protein
MSVIDYMTTDREEWKKKTCCDRKLIEGKSRKEKMTEVQIDRSIGNNSGTLWIEGTIANAAIYKIDNKFLVTHPVTSLVEVA